MCPSLEEIILKLFLDSFFGEMAPWHPGNIRRLIPIENIRLGEIFSSQDDRCNSPISIMITI